MEPSKTMIAAVLHWLVGVTQVGENSKVTLPDPQTGQVLVRVLAAGVNPLF